MRWLKFRREMRSILRRPLTLGVDLSCADDRHEWVDGELGERICSLCGQRERKP